MVAYFEGGEVRQLQVLLEEVTRAKPGSPESRFVKPDESDVDRLGSKFNHVLYGRRGSGKTSLLRYIQSRQRELNRIVAWVDYEILMNLSFPDVLVSTLEQMFTDFADEIQASGVELKSGERKHIWNRREDRSSKEVLLWDLRDVSSQLSVLKNSPDSSSFEWKTVQSVSSSVSLTAGGALSANMHGGEVTGSLSRQSKKSNSSERSLSTVYSAKKEEHLERSLTTYRNLVQKLTSEFPDAFVILDEVYRLKEDDQPAVVGYLHRVLKDTGVWLKIGSLRFGTKLYSAGPPAVGLQDPHDIRQLSLDRGLLDFKNSKRFLEEILSSLAGEVNVDINKLFTDGALDRSVLAAGGVPRDYIGILSESIAVARNRGPSNKLGSDRVIAEDVNEAAGRTVESKFNDLDEIAGEDRAELRDIILRLTAHCRTTKSACFLIDIQDGHLVEVIDRLQNMRFVHLLDINESLPDSSSSRYTVYLLDVSQLAAQRALQLDFMGWTSREKRRSRKLVFRGGSSTDAKQEREIYEGIRRGSPLTILDQSIDQADEDAIVREIDPPVGL